MNTTMPPATGAVDTHAHVFLPSLRMAPNRRYSPDYPATPEDYLGQLDQAGMAHGVLVQPSFLGTDNSYLLDALAAYPQRLRGIAVVDSTIDPPTLKHMDTLGVRGIRLNLVGKELMDATDPQWQPLWENIRTLNWSVEVQRNIDDVTAVVEQLLEQGLTTVVDHYGLPKGGVDKHQAQYQRLTQLMQHHPELWMKVSAPYRSGITPHQAHACIDAVVNACGHANQLVWGSDWPHTQFEDRIDYAQMTDFLAQAIPEAAERQRILVDNAARLFRL